MHPDDAVRRIAEMHAQKIRNPFGRCKEASERLARDLNKAGIAVRVMRCSDGIMNAPRADRRWLKLKRAPQSWIHYVVETQKGFIDLTRRQFHPDAPHPYYCQVSDLQREWQSIQEHSLEIGELAQ